MLNVIYKGESNKINIRENKFGIMNNIIKSLKNYDKTLEKEDTYCSLENQLYKFGFKNCKNKRWEINFYFHNKKEDLKYDNVSIKLTSDFIYKSVEYTIPLDKPKDWGKIFKEIQSSSILCE